MGKSSSTKQTWVVALECGADSTLKYLSDAAKGHRSLRRYSTLHSIEKIIEGNSLQLTDGHNWNDIEDRQRFNSQHSAFHHFGMCFSYSTDESIAMWMLYGGMEHEGAALELSSKDRRLLLRKDAIEQIELLSHVDGGYKSVDCLPLDEVHLDFCDVAYYLITDSGEIKLKHYSSAPTQSSDSLKELVLGDSNVQMKHCFKAYPWNYEQETRYVISVPKERVANITNPTIRVSFDLDLSAWREKVVLAPNNFSKQGRYRKSRMTGWVSWNLCENCEGGIVRD